MKTVKKILTLTFLYLIFCNNNEVYAQNLTTKIDSLILSKFKDQNGPGGVFMVSKNGQPIYKKAFGKANLELNVDLTTENIFQLGSMTKQFTAVAVLMLQEQGKLNVNENIAKYIADYPGGEKITLHHLLTHTSGIKDFTKMNVIKNIANKEMTPKMLADLFKNEPVDFLPGEKFDYNNSGYVLLGHIIELVSGETYENFIVNNIFKKIGMNESYYATDRQLINKRAYGYSMKENSYVNKTIINYSVPYASGSLMSNLKDLQKWQSALNLNLLLTAEATKKVFSTYKLNNGEEFTYGYGWHIRDIDSTPTIEHGGSIFGYKSMAVYIPSKDIYVVGLSNCDCNSPTQLVLDIAKISLQKTK